MRLIPQNAIQLTFGGRPPVGGAAPGVVDAGRVVVPLGGARRPAATVDSLLAQFRAQAGKDLDNDRMLFTKQ